MTDPKALATPHPTEHGLTNVFWTDLGRQLADARSR